MIIRQDDAEAAKFAGSIIGCEFSQPFVGLVVDDGFYTRGAVVFNNFDRVNIDMSGAGFGCWTPGVVRELARYAFGQLKCKRITARTRVSNKRVLRALERIGFKREGTLRFGFGNEDAALFGLLASEQKLIRL